MKAPRFRFNNSALQNAFDRLTDHIDSLSQSKKVVAGENIRKQETQDEIIIHGTPAGAQVQPQDNACSCPWDVEFIKEDNESGDERYTAMMYYGRVNNVTTDKVELKTNIDPSDESPEEKYVILSVAFGTNGGISEYQITEEGSMPDDAKPSLAYPTNAKIVLGVREGMAYHRIIGCHNIAIYPIRIGGMESQYWSYEVISV
jgi:hypothetical protein